MQDRDISRALYDVAARLGMRLVPAIYDIVPSPTGGTKAQGAFLVDDDSGPFFCTDWAPSTSSVTAAAGRFFVDVRTAGRSVVEGQAEGLTLFLRESQSWGPTPTRRFHAPLIVPRGDPLRLEITALSGDTINAHSWTFSGFHARALDGSLLGSAADALAQAMRAEIGELVLAGFELDGTDTDGLTFSQDVELQTIQHALSGAGTRSFFTVRAGNVELMPIGILGEPEAFPTPNQPMRHMCNINVRQGNRLQGRAVATAPTRITDVVATGARRS